jgi:predicted PurR-regulated permease PerM
MDVVAMLQGLSNMNLKLTPGRILAAALIVLAAWIVHAFIDALLAAGVTAIASWPYYERFMARLPRRIGRSAGSALFTGVVTVFVLAPMAFAGWALLGELHSLLLDLAAADSRGMAVPPWLADAPLAGPWLAARWQSQLGRPGALLMLTQRADPAALLGWAQSLGQFTVRQAFTIGFTILLLGFLYQEGPALVQGLTGALRRAIGDRAERYVALTASAVRASVSSMLVVGLFDAVAIGLAYGVSGTPRALVWAAITGALATVPFLGYAALAAMAVQLAVRGAATTALLALALGCAVLLCGDKVVRPMVARGGIRLPFVWVLMGCIGGFGALGLAGLVIGPVALSLARELWKGEPAPGSPERYRSLPAAD